MTQKVLYTTNRAEFRTVTVERETQAVLDFSLDDLFKKDINIDIPDHGKITTEEVVRELSSSQFYTRSIDMNELFQWIGDGRLAPIQFSRLVDTLSMGNSFLEVENKSEFYEIFQIPKRTGGKRTIKSPLPELKAVQTLYKEMLEITARVHPHNSAFAYIKGRSVKHALEVHQANQSKWFLKLDLKNFFDNCTPEFIERQLRKLYPFALFTDQEYQSFITHIVAVGCLDNGLPQGTPLSPTLTNLLMVEFDKWMTEYAYANALRYTRYADDLIISSKYSFRFDPIVSDIIEYMEENDYPFTVNESKTRYGSSSGSNFNLGLMLNKENNITIGHRKKKELKNSLFFFYKNQADWDSYDKYKLLGELEWLRANEPEVHSALIAWFNRKHRCDILELLKA